MTDSHPQRRHLTRIPFDTEFRIRLDNDATSYHGHVIDLSLKGALLERPPELNVDLDTAFKLELLLEEDTARITMEVRVAHLHPTTIGVVCEHLDLNSMSHLCRFLELNLGSRDELERELNEMLKLNTH